MLRLKQLFDFYLDASIHVALAVFALTVVSGLMLSIPFDTHLSTFLFFGTIAAYNFVKYGVEAKKYILVANAYHKNIQVLSLLCLAISVYHAFFFTWQVWKCILFLLFLTGLYALPVLPHSRNIRSWGGFKIFVVAMVWSGTTVHLPVISGKLALDWDVWVLAFQRFVLVLVLLLPFEVRDLKYDLPDLRTLPQRFGMDKVKIFGVLGAFIFFMSTFIKGSVDVLDLLSNGIALILLLLGILFTKTEQSRYYASFWVESIPIVWCFVVWALSLCL
tara:strand:+ start:74889 stop:75713 length:825 start_codon:yes stop_codon:yes gene_type:complete